MRKKSNFIVQGGILAAAGILSRIIGIARRFPMEHYWRCGKWILFGSV